MWTKRGRGEDEAALRVMCFRNSIVNVCTGGVKKKGRPPRRLNPPTTAPGEKAGLGQSKPSLGRDMGKQLHYCQRTNPRKKKRVNTPVRSTTDRADGPEKEGTILACAPSVLSSPTIHHAARRKKVQVSLS